MNRRLLPYDLPEIEYIISIILVHERCIPVIFLARKIELRALPDIALQITMCANRQTATLRLCSFGPEMTVIPWCFIWHEARLPG